jgi:hypothetical protein
MGLLRSHLHGFSRHLETPAGNAKNGALSRPTVRHGGITWPSDFPMCSVALHVPDEPSQRRWRGWQAAWPHTLLCHHEPRTDRGALLAGGALFVPHRCAATGGAPVAASTIEVDKANFQKEVVQSRVPVLLDCYAEYADDPNPLLPPRPTQCMPAFASVKAWSR